MRRRAQKSRFLEVSKDYIQYIGAFLTDPVIECVARKLEALWVNGISLCVYKQECWHSLRLIYIEKLS